MRHPSPFSSLLLPRAESTELEQLIIAGQIHMIPFMDFKSPASEVHPPPYILPNPSYTSSD